MEDKTGVDFYVHGYQQIQIGDFSFYITTSHVCLAIVMVVLIAFAVVANRVIKKADYRKTPTGFLNVLELLVETVDKLIVVDIMSCAGVVLYHTPYH